MHLFALPLDSFAGAGLQPLAAFKRDQPDLMYATIIYSPTYSPGV